MVMTPKETAVAVQALALLPMIASVAARAGGAAAMGARAGGAASTMGKVGQVAKAAAPFMGGPESNNEPRRANFDAGAGGDKMSSSWLNTPQW